MGVLAPGTEIAARYRLDRLLGEGGMGEVWAVTHLVTGKRLALKALKAHRAARQDSVKRFFREARAATVVGHPNVVQVHDVFLHDGIPVMVLDLLEGESLGDKLEREGKLSLAELSALMVPVLSAIGTAHARGIVHRDLKPENIFLARDAVGKTSPIVLDFGIAKLSGFETDAEAAAVLTRTGSMMGTPFYMSPEQASGEKDLDHGCDVWALGVILYECLSGQRPFDGENFGQVFNRIITRAPTPLSDLCSDLPAEVIALVDGMLQKARAARAADLHGAFATLQRYTQVEARAFGEPLSDTSSSPSETKGVSLRPSQSDIETLTDTDTTQPTYAEPSAAGAVERRPFELQETLEAAAIDASAARSVRRPARLARWLALCLVAAAFVAVLVLSSSARWSKDNAAATTAPGASATEPSSAATLPPAQAALTSPVPATPSSLSTAQSVETAGASAAPPAAKKPVRSLAAKPPAAASAHAAKKLPGGILDQEQAPF
jgi:eukaryotic-like serine/threonine-protein kinase